MKRRLTILTPCACACGALQLCGNWVELETHDGDVYFANIVTKETSWDMPAAAEEEAGNKENAVPEAAAMSPAPHKPERVTESRPTVPLGWSSHNANGARFHPDVVNETKASISAAHTPDACVSARTTTRPCW